MKLKDKNLSYLIFSADHKKLAKWYEKVLGFKVREVIDMPHEHFVDFDFGENYFAIGHHGKVKGKNKDIYRHMIGFNVESVSRAYQDLKNKPVTFIARPFEAPPDGYWCMTLKDPEGNILQFFGDK